jgi:BirA family biotin operon repressor/biotin-[acetyl-CoA-carboxylase] ligase
LSPASQAEPVRIGDWRHLALGDVGSTNTECIERARAGDPGNLWITGERQLQGRGRRGRAWVSEAGNLYASLLLIDPAPAEALASLPLVVAVAVHRAIEAVLPVDRTGALKIKWPNDILLSGAKICGILLESETLSDGRRAVVIGQGINVAHAPPAGLYETTSLAAAGVVTAPDLLFARLLTAMEEELGVWNRGAGLASTLAAWRARAGGIGEPITVNLGERSLRGRFSTIDAAGRLVLHTQDGKDITIAAGDLFFGHGG